ncbi:MAG: SDR family NAD(P)-dependent oxidoreductase [Rhodospirillaceae bacterium]|nr:SDR family NAD(P)-dependent oxidoreductase [Rhodospirillaceae bacterium]
MRLDGKAMLITGAGSGIGRALAVACAKQGARLLLVGRRVGKLEETRALLPSAELGTILRADVTQGPDRQAIRQTITDNFGRLDVLVNNAGVPCVGPLRDTGDDELQCLLATNLLAPMALTRDLLNLLRASETPRIVNVGSVFGDIGHPLFAAYSASKFGLRGFSDAARRELMAEGIAVTYVAPRATHSETSHQFDHLIEPFSMTVDSAEVAADQILSAIRRDARSSYARGAERFFVILQRLAPRLIDQALGQKVPAQPPTRGRGLGRQSS